MRGLVTLRLIKGDWNCQESSVHGVCLWHVQHASCWLRYGPAYSGGGGGGGRIWAEERTRGKNSASLQRTEIDAVGSSLRSFTDLGLAMAVGYSRVVGRRGV